MRSERSAAVLIKEVDVERDFGIVEAFELGVAPANFFVTFVLQLLDLLDGDGHLFLFFFDLPLDCF